MAVVGRGLYKCFRPQRCVFNSALRNREIQKPILRTYFTANHLTKITDPKPNDYEYELSTNENEWKYVERLMPLKVIPDVTPKSEYPSGWRPQTAEALTHPYYVERVVSHMLPVYLKVKQRGVRKITCVKNIHGDIWRLHDELKEHLEKEENKIIHSSVHEGNCQILFKGDHVYYCEQWLLGKGM